MTEVRDKRSLFEAHANSSAGHEKKRRPPPSPPKLLKPSLSAHDISNPPRVSVSGNQLDAERTSSGNKINKLSPALLRKAERGVGVSPKTKPKAKTPSPSLLKKSTSASKLMPPKPAPSGETHEKTSEMGKQGVGLLASVMSRLSASTDNLDLPSPSLSTSTPTPRKPLPPPPKKTPSPKMQRQSAVDVSCAPTARVQSEPTRPASTASTESPHKPNGSTVCKNDEESHSLRRGSPVVSSGSPVSRRRNGSRNSLERSFSPPRSSRSPSNRAVSTHLHSINVLGSKTSDDLRGNASPRGKPRSSSTSKLENPPLKREKPIPPPKKPGLMSKPAPPPKPRISQLKQSPHFPKRVASPDSIQHSGEITRSYSPELSTSEKPGSVLVEKPRKQFSPRSTSSPNAPHLRRETPGVISPLQSTPSPRTSQLEAVQRNADSGFESGTAEDPASPIETINGIGEEQEEGDKKTEAQTTEAPLEVWDKARLEKARNKRLHIAEELLSTEVSYVERLHVIAVKFHGAVRDFSAQHKNVIPDADVNRIFLNITEIHNLNTNILEALQERMDTWSEQEGLGDVIGRLAPFLKLYAHYTAGFEDAMKLLTSWTKRDKKFDALVREFERELSTGLGVAHYMLEPIQRIPRYKLLLTDYLKYVPPDSPERVPTQKALDIISEAADHSNDRIKELENSNTILSIQRSLQDFEGTLLAPGRLFIRKGQLQKFSRKTTTPRMFFLFSDMLLHTEPTGTDVYKFKNEMPIFMMKVEDPVVKHAPHSFNVESTTRSLILVASSEPEKNEWMSELRRVINEERKKRSSLRRDINTKVLSGVFGAQAPIMVPDRSVTMCQACSAEFTFTFRRHHCRGCGKVVCGTCSQWKAFLPYLKKFERVCERCNYISKSESGEEVDAPLPSPKMSRKEGGGGILNLKAYEEDTIKGGYVLSQDGRKWNRLWYQIRQDFCLYKFRAHEDIKAMSSLPLPGYIVSCDEQAHTITLTHSSSKKELSETFKVENPEDFNIWVCALKSVVQLEVPSLPSQSKMSSPPDERLRSQSLMDPHIITVQTQSALENSI